MASQYRSPEQLTVYTLITQNSLMCLIICILKQRAQYLLVWNNAPPHIRRLSPNIYLRGFGSSGMWRWLTFSKRFLTFRRIVALSISREGIAGGYSFTSQTTRKLNTTTLRTLNLIVFGDKFRITKNHWKRIYFHNSPPHLFKLVAGGRRGYADYSSNRLLVCCFRGFLPWLMTLM